MTKETDIRLERKRRGLSQAEAAEQARIGRTTFAEWEAKGYAKLAETSLTNTLARASLVRIDAWLRGPPCPPPKPVYDREHELPPEPDGPLTDWNKEPVALENHSSDSTHTKAKAWMDTSDESEPEVAQEPALATALRSFVDRTDEVLEAIRASAANADRLVEEMVAVRQTVRRIGGEVEEVRKDLHRLATEREPAAGPSTTLPAARRALVAPKA